MTQAICTRYQFDHTYDGAGNRTALAIAGNLYSDRSFGYTYNAWGNVTQVTENVNLNNYVAAVTSDANGNITEIDETWNGQDSLANTFEYDFENRLVEHDCASVGVTVEHKYDGLGRLLRTDRTVAGPTTTTFEHVRDGLKVVGNIDATNTNTAPTWTNHPNALKPVESQQLQTNSAVQFINVSDEIAPARRTYNPSTSAAGDTSAIASKGRLVLVNGALPAVQGQTTTYPSELFSQRNMTYNENSIALSSDRGALELSGVNLMYEGTRVKSWLIGRDMNPAGRGDGSHYALGDFEIGSVRPVPTSTPVRGRGNSVNNSYCPPGGGCGEDGGESPPSIFPPQSPPEIFIPWITPTNPSPIYPDSRWNRDSHGVDCGFPSLDVYWKALADCDSIQDSPEGGSPKIWHPDIDAGPGEDKAPVVISEDDCFRKAFAAFWKCFEKCKEDYAFHNLKAISMLAASYSLLSIIRQDIANLLRQAAAVAAGQLATGHSAATAVFYRFVKWIHPGVAGIAGLYYFYGWAGGNTNLASMAEEYFNLLFKKAEILSYIDYGWCLHDNAKRQLWNDYHDCLCALHSDLRKCVLSKCRKAPAVPSACNGDSLKDECSVQLRDCEDERHMSAISRKSQVLKYSWFYGFKALVYAPLSIFGLAYLSGYYYGVPR